MNVIEANRHHIEAALEYSGGTHIYEDVERGILEGRMQIWPGKNGCAVTELVRYPQKMVLNVFLAAGEMDAILDMLESAKLWGLSQGCSSMTVAGRKGWKRVLEPYGFKEVFTVLEVRVDDKAQQH